MRAKSRAYNDLGSNIYAVLCKIAFTAAPGGGSMQLSLHRVDKIRQQTVGGGLRAGIAFDNTETR